MSIPTHLTTEILQEEDKTYLPLENVHLVIEMGIEVRYVGIGIKCIRYTKGSKQFKILNNLGKYIKNNKSKADENMKSGIYKLNCKDCDNLYIGKSLRNFEIF